MILWKTKELLQTEMVKTIGSYISEVEVTLFLSDFDGVILHKK